MKKIKNKLSYLKPVARMDNNAKIAKFLGE